LCDLLRDFPEHHNAQWLMQTGGANRRGGRGPALRAQDDACDSVPGGVLRLFS
jgi:hypothetical protein